MSFLCDRETTQIPQGQPSFVSYILLPLYQTVSQLMPQVKQLEENARSNMEKWKTYEESDRFKKVYIRKTPEQRKSEEEHEKNREGSYDSDDQINIGI